MIGLTIRRGSGQRPWSQNGRKEDRLLDMRCFLGVRAGTVWVWTAIALLQVVGFLSSCGPSSEAEPMLPQQTISPDAQPVGGLKAEEPGPTLPQQAIPPDAMFIEEPRPKEQVAIHPKLDSTLNQLLQAYDGQGIAGAQAFAETHGMVLEGQRVQVSVFTIPEAVDGLTEAIEGLGGEVQGHYKGLVQALVPIEALVSLAELPEVQQIREPQRAVP